MAVLTIDQGNSSCKAAVWVDGKRVKGIRIPQLTVEAIVPLLEEGEVSQAVFSSVCKIDAKFLESLRRLLDGHLLVVTSATPLPINLKYATPATLGADRIATAAGAFKVSKGRGALVVDAGTAMTLDVVAGNGDFMGGNIAPGLQLRFRSLHEATSLLPLVDPEGEIPEFGTDTVTAIRSGVLRGMAAEIESAFRDAKKLHQTEELILTGSDAVWLLPLLENSGLTPANEPSLLEKGLVEILNFNNHA